jgi:predicted PhzF superfamily epimerase YddE/YHI9
MSITYYHIDSCASELFARNSAGSCLLSAFPVNDARQKIAAENGHRETAFVVAELNESGRKWFGVDARALRSPLAMANREFL